jgi:hypothetical protein
VFQLVDELLVECVHREEGCTHICQRQLLASHLRDECTYSEVPCPERDCAGRMLRKDIDTHMDDKHKGRPKNEPSSEEEHISELVSCVFQFQSMLVLKDEVQSCESLSCPQSRNGCPFTTTDAYILSSHTTSCAYHGLKEFFGMSAARHASLVEQNVLLRHRVSALEASVQILRREMEAVRRTLGPWFRMETAAAHQAVRIGYNGLHPRSQTSVQPDVASPLVEDGSNQGGLAAIAATGAGGEVLSSAEMLASYFPSFGSGDTGSTSNIPDTHNRGPHWSTLPSSAPERMNQGLHETYPLNLGFPPMRTPMLPHLAPQAPTSRAMHAPGSIVTIPQLSSLITPLDLGNTLEGTLNGLHDNVLGLATGVDSLSRRSEIALANESLRFGEEIMSLRAGINGLRMQVRRAWRFPFWGGLAN